MIVLDKLLENRCFPFVNQNHQPHHYMESNSLDHNAELRKLQAKIDERRAFLVKVVGSVNSLVREVGVKICESTSSSHTRQTFLLENFHRFSFQGDYGKTSHGGNDIRIDFECHHVLTVYWQSADFDPISCRVSTFSNDPAWQAAVLAICDNIDKLVAEYRAKGNQKTEILSQADLEKIQRDGLREIAGRLGLD